MGVFDSLLNNTFTVERRMRTTNGQGGWAISYLTIGTLLGRICPKSTSERLVAESEEAQITHVLYCRTTNDIARGDMVTCGDLVVEVLGVREPSEANEHWEIDCLERQEETREEPGS